MSRLERKQKLNDLKTNKVKSRQKVEKVPSRNGNGHFQTRIISVTSSQKQKEHNSDKADDNFHGLSQKARDFIESIKRE